MSPVPPGVPTDSDRVFCTSNASASCYFYDPWSKTYARAKAACAARGGYLVAYNSAEEQLQVGSKRGVCIDTCAFTPIPPADSLSRG